MDRAWDISVYNIGYLLAQFMIQYVTGIYFQKGMSIFDILGFFNPYLLMLMPGLLYFAGLKFIQHSLLILLDMEDNTRRAARNK